MAGILMRSDFDALSTPAAGKALQLLFEDGDKDILKFLDKLYNIETTDDPFKQNLTMSGLGLLYGMPEGSRIRLDKMRQGRAKVYLGDVFNIAVGYTMQMKRADKSGAILRAIPKELKKAYQQTREIAGAKRYMDGFTLQGDEPDGVPWFSTSHGLLRSIDGSTVWSNRSSTDAALSYTSLRQARQDLMLTLSDSGRQDPIMATELLVGPALESDAFELTNSTLIPGPTPGTTGGSSQQQNTINVVKSLFRLTTPFCNPYWRSKPNMWVLRRALSDIHVHWYDFMDQVYDTHQDFHTKVFFQDVTAEWNYGADDTRGMYGSPGPA